MLASANILRTNYSYIYKVDPSVSDTFTHPCTLLASLIDPQLSEKVYFGHQLDVSLNLHFSEMR